MSSPPVIDDPSKVEQSLAHLDLSAFDVDYFAALKLNKLESLMMFLRSDGFGSVMATPAPADTVRKNRFGSYTIQFLRVYSHFVHVVKVRNTA